MALTVLHVQILATLGVLASVFVIYPMVRNLFTKNVTSRIKKHDQVLIKRLLNMSIGIVAVFVLLGIWNYGFGNIWTNLFSILALIGIGFFAVWSILSNIIAGITLFLTKPFEIGDTIRIVPDDITGEVMSVHSMFTLLKDEKGNEVYIPNNLFFQKVIYNIQPQK